MGGHRVYLDYVPQEEKVEKPLGDDPEVSARFFRWFLDEGMPCLTEPTQLPCPVKSKSSIHSLNITLVENVKYVQRMWRLCAYERLRAIRDDREEKERQRKRNK